MSIALSDIVHSIEATVARERESPSVSASCALSFGLQMKQRNIEPLRRHFKLGAAWVNIDCDLYAGTRDALAHVGGHLREGSRVHFHELVKV